MSAGTMTDGAMTDGAMTGGAMTGGTVREPLLRVEGLTRHYVSKGLFGKLVCRYCLWILSHYSRDGLIQKRRLFFQAAAQIAICEDPG